MSEDVYDAILVMIYYEFRHLVSIFRTEFCNSSYWLGSAMRYVPCFVNLHTPFVWINTGFSKIWKLYPLFLGKQCNLYTCWNENTYFKRP